MKAEEAVSQVIVQLGWSEVAVGVLILSAVQFLIGLWIRAHVESSIKHEYDKRLKDYDFAIKKKEQAVRIAQLLADFSYSRKPDPKDYLADIWALTLWLPPSLVRHLTEFLVSKNPAMRDPKALLIAIRKELHGADDPLEADQIAHIDSISDIMNKRNFPSPG